MLLEHHVAAGEAEPSPGKGRSPDRAALRGRDSDKLRSSMDGVHANGAEVCSSQTRELMHEILAQLPAGSKRASVKPHVKTPC